AMRSCAPRKKAGVQGGQSPKLPGFTSRFTKGYQMVTLHYGPAPGELPDQKSSWRGRVVGWTAAILVFAVTYLFVSLAAFEPRQWLFAVVFIVAHVAVDRFTASPHSPGAASGPSRRVLAPLPAARGPVQALDEHRGVDQRQIPAAAVLDDPQAQLAGDGLDL